MKIHVTEHKSHGTLRYVGNCVRMFVDNDYHYGYFIDERRLFARLTPEQREQYLATEHEIHLTVEPDVGEKLVRMGFSPYKSSEEIE